jgi:hypothetical protein
MSFRLVATTLLLACAVHAQISVAAQVWATTGGTARGFTAVVDLTDPRLDIHVTDPLNPPQSYEAVLETTLNWHTRNNLQLSINANYFGTFTATTADIVGVSKSAGFLVSPIRQFGAAPDPALVIGINRIATIGNITASQAASAWWAVAGVGPSTTDTVPGTLLVTDGVNTGSTARVDPLNRNPRTAIGTNALGTLLYIAVVDGRQTGWSVGMTLPETANVLLGMGAYRAINLDGGGSTSLIWSPPGGSLVQNRPSGGTHRAVANHLGFSLGPTGVVTVGASCGGAGIISSTGDFRLGSTNFAVQLQGAPAGSLPFLALGFPGSETTCGACAFVNAASYNYVPLAGSAASWQWLLPSNPTFVGTVVGSQWLLLQTASAACGNAPGLAATARLHMALGL